MATILCLGISVLDYVYAVEEMPQRAEKYRSNRLMVVGGGLAANAAVAVARLGGVARLATRLGDDLAGDTILEGLRAEGVDCSPSRRFKGRQSSVSAVMIDPQGERMVVSFSDPDMPSSTDWITSAMLEGVDAVQGDTRWEEGALKLFRLAAERGLPSVLDLDRAPTNTSLIGAPSHAAFSETGLAEASGESDPEAGLRVLWRQGYRNNLIVTLGARGVMWLEGQQLRHLPAYPVKVVDTLAAGDVWHGAFTLALGEGMPQTEAIRFASAAAALKCTQFGGRAGTPSRQTVEAFQKEHRE